LEVEITAITMRGDRPIYRNHQTCPDTDHQPLPRLCHEAVLYNRLTEIGLAVKDVFGALDSRSFAALRRTIEALVRSSDKALDYINAEVPALQAAE
jgi:hypothetical protein